MSSTELIRLWRSRVTKLRKYQGKNAHASHFQRIEGRIESYRLCIKELGVGRKRTPVRRKKKRK